MAGANTAPALHRRPHKTPTATGEWVRRLLARAHPNVVVVALAAKLARIAWAVLRHGRSFDRQVCVAA